MGDLVQWIGNLLGIPSDVIVAGDPSHWQMRRILRRYGVNVRRIRTERTKGSRWWQYWNRQADIIVGRHQHVIAADILREHGFEVVSPEEGSVFMHPLPPKYAARIHAIEMRRQQLDQPQVPPWMRQYGRTDYFSRNVDQTLLRSALRK